MLPRRAAPHELQRAIEALRAGRVVAMPTDTVYGLAAAVDRPEAIERIFELKGRAPDKALPVLVSDAAQLDRFGVELGAQARELAARFWPGALTIVVRAAGWVPDVILRGGDTVGLRMPASLDALAMIAGAGGALVVTSANPSGHPEALSADAARAMFAERVVIVDGGPSPGATPSTVVDATVEPFRVLRSGAIPPDDLRAAGPARE